MYKTILIDDERHALTTLKWEVESHSDDFEIVGQYTSAKKALEEMEQTKPDLIFLDIEMPKMNGFSFLEQIKNIDCEFIFVTAYHQYAVRAFRTHAVDYLLKPVETKDLLEALQRTKVKLEKKLISTSAQKLKLEGLKLSFNKIAIPKTNGVEFVYPDQIVYCQSDGSYTNIFFENRKVVITRSMKEMEEHLNKYGFLRVHKSYLVNVSHISEYVRSDGGYLIMSNGEKVEVSRRKKEQLTGLFGLGNKK